MPKSFISTNYIAFIPANRNAVGISHKVENIRLARFGFKSASEVKCHGIIICRQVDSDVYGQLTVCPITILFAYRQLDFINSLTFQIDSHLRYLSWCQHLAENIRIHCIILRINASELVRNAFPC